MPLVPLWPSQGLCYNEGMKKTFYFYDLETSGLGQRDDRIMQFAGQRTDLDFNPIGEPANIMVRLGNDSLPSPYAVMVTGITPQATQQDGLSEREFCQFFTEEIAWPGTTILGYNSVRFDDEFIRATLWRNFYDPYEWQWKDGRSRWDMLDVVRLTRALRPEGIKWPVTPEGKPTNRLELLTKENAISHEHAHDALADVAALIEVTKLIKQHQPQLFDYLYNIRGKRGVQQVVNPQQPRPFVYASGRYPSKYLHTTVAYPLAPLEADRVLVYDLRYNLDELLTARNDGKLDELLERKPHPDREAPATLTQAIYPVVKPLQYNHCPAVAPLGVLEKQDGWAKLQLTPEQIQQNLQSLRAHPEIVQQLVKENKVKAKFPPSPDAESALYDGFLDNADRNLCAVIRINEADKLADFHPKFADRRLPELFMHYKAKNFPEILTEDEAAEWEKYRLARLNRQAPKFLEAMQQIQGDLSAGKTFGNKSAEECDYLAQELSLWYESLQAYGE